MLEAFDVSWQQSLRSRFAEKTFFLLQVSFATQLISPLIFLNSDGMWCASYFLRLWIKTTISTFPGFNWKLTSYQYSCSAPDVWLPTCYLHQSFSAGLLPLCGQNCATCPYITNGLTSYTFYATGETRSITSHITCNTKNVIYMVQCNRCNLQYIGETKRRLKDRFN